MKTIIPLFVAALCTLSLVACKKEGCTNAYAENYNSDAKKDDGSCTYLSDKLLGTYAVSQSCQYDGSSTYIMNVLAGANKGEVILQGFADSVDIKATINGTKFNFKEDKSGVTFEGSGYLVGSNQITINTEVCETYYYPCSDPDVCTLTCTN